MTSLSLRCFGVKAVLAGRASSWKVSMTWRASRWSLRRWRLSPKRCGRHPANARWPLGSRCAAFVIPMDMFRKHNCCNTSAGCVTGGNTAYPSGLRDRGLGLSAVHGGRSASENMPNSHARQDDVHKNGQKLYMSRARLTLRPTRQAPPRAGTDRSAAAGDARSLRSRTPWRRARRWRSRYSCCARVAGFGHG